MPYTDHDPTLWRPAHALDLRRAAHRATRRAATHEGAAGAAAAEPPYRRIPCPSCGHVTDDESLLDVRALTPTQREAFGFHPDAEWACAPVCLNDALNAGVSLVAVLRALGAPAEALHRAKAHDDTHPVRMALARRGEAARPAVRRRGLPPIPFQVDASEGSDA